MAVRLLLPLGELWVGPCGAGKRVSPVPGHRPSCAPTSLWLTLPGSPANDATVGPERESNPLKATQLGGVWFHSGPYRLARVSQGHDAGASQGWRSPCCSRFPQMLVFGVRRHLPAGTSTLPWPCDSG